MKRIIKSFLILIIIIAFTSSATFAFFTSKAKINDLTFSTGNANLQISKNANIWSQNLTPGINFENITPNWQNDYKIFVKNNGKTNLILNLKGELQSGWDDQENLREIIKIHVLELNDANEEVHDFGEKTLEKISDELEGGLNLNQIDKEETRTFVLKFSVADNLDEKYQNQSLSGFNFVFYGENKF